MLRPKKKYCCFWKHGQKNRVGRSVFFVLFFYNGAYKYTKLLHTFLSFCLLVTLYFDMFCYRKNHLDDDKQLELQ